jgi:hypothetical protein
MIITAHNIEHLNGVSVMVIHKFDTETKQRYIKAWEITPEMELEL